MSNTVRVVIAPWGDPFGWRKAKYLFKTPDGQRIGPIEASTTLGVWLKFIKPDNGDRICLIVPDTVLDKKYQTKEFFEEFATKGYLYYKEIVKKSICNYLQTQVEKYDSDLVKVYINYNTGTFNNLKFERKATDYYLNLFWIFYKFFFEELKILDLIGRSGSQKLQHLEVYLDTTHGVNFMPTLTLKALKTFLEALSAAPIKITLRVYNAEPVVPFNSNEVSEFLEIHEETFEKLFTQIRFLSEDKRNWIEDNKNYESYEEVLKFLAGAIKGYPLLIFNNFDLKVKTYDGREKKLDTNFIRDRIDNYERNLKLEVDFCNFYKYPKNTPEFIGEVIRKIKELENKGLIQVNFEWRKTFLKLKNEGSALLPELDLLIIAWILKLILQEIYKVETKNEVSLSEMEKLLGSLEQVLEENIPNTEFLYKKTPLQSYVLSNWMSFIKDDLCSRNKNICTNSTCTNNSSPIKGSQGQTQKEIRNFQSHLGLLNKLLKLIFDEKLLKKQYCCNYCKKPKYKDCNTVSLSKDCNEFLKENKKRISVAYQNIDTKMLQKLIKNDLFGIPIN
jgi:CRISPR-associated protein Csx1